MTLLNTIYDAFNSAVNITTGTESMTGTILIMAIALMSALLGYKCLRFLTLIAGAATGAALGIYFGHQYKLEDLMVIILAFVCAAVVAFISFMFYKAGIFITMFVSGYVLGFGVLADTMPDNPMIPATAGLILGLIIAIAAMFLVRVIVICSTGMVGGYLFAGGLFRVMTLQDPSKLSSFTAIVAIVAGVIGIVIQFLTAEKREIDGF